jgi:two-component system, response regulator PdtaR
MCSERTIRLTRTPEVFSLLAGRLCAGLSGRICYLSKVECVWSNAGSPPPSAPGLLLVAGTALPFRAARREEELVMQHAAQATAALNLVIVEDDPVVRQFLKDTVEQLGHQVTGEAATGADMVRIVLSVEPDIVLFDIHLPGLNGLDALRQIYQERVFAAVAITADRDQDLVRRALEEHVLAYLVKPIEAHQIGPALMVAKARFEEWRGLQAENENLRKTLENRKTIERAKGVLMKRHRWSEAEAFRRLQRAAMNRRTTMVDLAQSVLNGVEIEL